MIEAGFSHPEKGEKIQPLSFNFGGLQNSKKINFGGLQSSGNLFHLDRKSGKARLRVYFLSWWF